MKRFILRVLPMALIGGLVLGSASVSASVFTIPGNHLLNDTEFGTAAYGPGTVAARAAGPGASVDFSFSGLGTSGTGVEDDFPVANVYGQTGGSFNSNFSNYGGYALQVKNLDDAPVWIQIYINTGWTVPDATADTYWQMPSWQYLNAGETAIVVLDFDYCQAIHIGDNSSPHTTGSEGDTLAINAYDRTQVTSIGFQVADFNGTNPAAAIRFSPPDAIEADPTTVRCLNIANPCDTVDVTFTRVDATPVRGFSVTFQLSAELALCGSVTASIREGTYLSGIGGTNYQVTSNGSGSYTVDCAILGLPCGATGSGTLFTIDVMGSGSGEATGTVTVTSVTVRDCNNGPVPAFPGAPTPITVDYTAPAPVADLAAAQQKTLNDSDGTTKVALTFTAPVSASVVEVYRAPFGNYPEYDDPPGAGLVPSAPSYPPGFPWALTTVTTSGGADETTARDFWYYVMFTKDACGNISGVSNMTAGTLNYHLGDVTPPAGGGDNRVNSIDISLLGTNYWKNLVAGDPVNYLDVGPTTDYSVNGRPLTDNKVGFEDLMMFSINFMQVSLLATPGPAAMEHPALALRLDRAGRETTDMLTVRLVLEDNTATVKGAHGVVQFDAQGLELVDVVRGGLLDAQQAPVFFEKLGDGSAVSIDVAALGTGQTVRGSGEIAVLRFRMTDAATTRPTLKVADLRDRNNKMLLARVRPGQIGDEVVAESKTVGGLSLYARPNPASEVADIMFTVPSEQTVSLAIYDVSGRLVRTLVDGAVGAGEHGVAWNCRDAGGRQVAPGIYVAILKAGDRTIKHKMSVLP
jgi:hypothetical protein